MRGRVVKLDRGFPLVRTEDGQEYRCEHAVSLVKNADQRAAIGDEVEISAPEGHDKGIIETILPRTHEFVRKDPTERAVPQVLAANFDTVLVVQSVEDIHTRRLERELVLAHETGAAVAIVLTKADLAESDERLQSRIDEVKRLAGKDEVVVVSTVEDQGLDQVRALVPEGETAILIGKSGVGKSTLINALVGHEMQETAEVRTTDGKGRHTTVNRAIIDIPGGGALVDMPGVRGLGLWEAEEGIGAAFPEVEELAAECKFRDCKHESEPGCAVRVALEEGALASERFDSYQALKRESEEISQRRDQSTQIRKGHPRRRK